jgi:hypothetical protein
MGGVGSGRSSTRSLVEHSLTIDLPQMMRRGLVKGGQRGTFRLRFSRTGEWVRLYYDLRDPDEAWLELNYRQYIRADVQPEVMQYIPLTFTVPYYGGRRWWMICDGQRVAKLYLPPGGRSFGSREAWRLVYSSQRVDERGRAFRRLSRLQRKLRCEERWGTEPSRPKGMWRSKYHRLLADFREADTRCSVLMEGMVSELRRHAA